MNEDSGKFGVILRQAYCKDVDLLLLVPVPLLYSVTQKLRTVCAQHVLQPRSGEHQATASNQY